jgi:hypothetical protein
MPLTLTATMYAQYVIEGRARAKLPALSRYLRENITITEYWRNVDRAHYFLSSRIPAPGQPAAAVTLSEAPLGGTEGRYATE